MELFDKYVGRVFDNRYRIEKIIGIGGMAVVFEAEDTVMRRKVAVKMLKEEISNDTQSVKRFINESKAVSMLSHPNIVSIYDVSVKDNLKYIVMEYVEGITLKNYINTRKVLGTSEVLTYTEQILRALEHAHSKSIIHRDIKPQNIMLLKNGQIKVADFGIAKLPNADTVTMTDRAIGTVFYISPEQASCKPIDPRSDLYSLGVMMYEMATGQLPFTADSPVSVALKQVNETPRRPREINPSIPVGLEQIIMGAMEKDPANRFQSASQMLRHVLQVKANPAIIFRTRRKKNTAAGTKNAGQTRTSSDNRRGGSNMLPIIAGVTAAFLLVLGISAAYILSKLFSDDVVEPYTITIRNYVGSPYDDVLKGQLEDTHYFNVKVTYAPDDTVEKGTVINQTPQSGERRKVLENQQFCDLELVVSSGEESIVLRDLTVTDYREAVEEIKKSGLIAEVVKEYNDSILDGYVIRTEPTAQTVMKKGDTVTVYVSKGQEIHYVTMPDFRGKTSSEGMALLTEYELGLDSVSYDYSDVYAKGEIMEQSLPPMSEVPRGTTSVAFVISLGRKPEETTAAPETEAPKEPVSPEDSRDEPEQDTEGEAETKRWYIGRN